MYPGGHMIWMAVAWAIGLAVIAGVLWTLLILINAYRGPARSSGSPEKTLERRLAAGELDVNEYEKRLAALSKSKRAA